ncbi:MAG: NADH dehydrogenase [Nitrospirae bacterium GWC2_57_13]|jgi:NADH dehydrogenase I D subunit|nr:MAG: NADH dehydrogenase [Nitrospirae bacterium GWC2_57_13]OGW43425.1 MAG: NADH dehydrogenase [Nitrospirae bacterium GWD2_57_8]HAR46013.1 NADH-quinone oxidoreductase subunit D [Nitrospiraceae bacterium]HAS53221.1 NADH-quinone oxidoreductase subunit D [Nitrospiraceae bacterium]
MAVTDTEKTTDQTTIKKEMSINMGPQHPSTHGVLRLVVDLEGETVVGVDPRPGYLHRGIEKWMESRTYHQIIPMTDRLEYISCMNNNIGYVVAVEKLAGIEVPERAHFIRTLTAELSRLSSHLIWLGSSAIDLGALTVIFYGLRERELILDLFEMATGARQTVSYARIGGVRNDLPRDFFDKCREFTELFPKRIDDYDTLLRENRIWLKRTKGIGVMSAEEAINYGLTGATLRGSGVNYDLRKVEPYAAYDKVEFDVPLGKNGDVYDRYIVRVEEMRQSVRIIRQCLELMKPGPIMTDDQRYAIPDKLQVMNDMSTLAHQFVLMSKWVPMPKGEVYIATEAPKGELGFYIVSDGSGKPYRIKIRAPSYVNLSAIPKMATGHMIADLIACIGTIDIVLGECDR